MSRSKSLADSSEVYSVFREQIETIKNKRSVKIKLSSFPSSATFAEICNVLVHILNQFVPVVYLEKISLFDNGLTALPNEFFLLCDSLLKVLDLHNNQFTNIPHPLVANCPNLERLDLSGNSFSILPSTVFSNFSNLKYLLLKDNNISYLPPILGELISLETLYVSGNPLIMPNAEVINSMTGGINDLKAYLVSNSNIIDQHIEMQTQASQSSGPLPSTPSVARARSLSDTRGKSLKASRRMGLIINSNKATPESNASNPASTSGANDSYTQSKLERNLLLAVSGSNDNSSGFIPREFSNKDEFNLGTSTYTTPTASIPRSSSPPSAIQSSFARPLRNRSNTLRDINQILEPNELSEDHKPGAYFRRLSTLQERPADESFKHISEEGSSLEPVLDDAKQASKKTQNSEHLQLSAPNKKVASNAQAPISNHNSLHSQAPTQKTHIYVRASQHDRSTIVKVARKILFSFSELHLSIKRFAGFCCDKKISTKIVSLLHLSKENIDILVETMEAVEDNGENHDSILSSLQTCISSFKMILSILSENFASFVAKIDVCFIRMVFLTLFGSLNELQNAHKLLSPNTSTLKSQSTLLRNHSAMSDLPSGTPVDAKAKNLSAILGLAEEGANENPALPLASETVASLDEIDERLYQSINVATANAQVVFSELTKAMSKSAIATANAKANQPINPTVALKFKELTNVCISSMEITKRLSSKLATIRTNQNSYARRSFWDDINLFLKAIIQTFSSVKGIMKDAPILNEIRRSMANLTKTTKELTIFLEASSYKTMSDLLGSPPLGNVLPSGSSILLAGSISASSVNLLQLASIGAVRTPIAASIGTAAAQAMNAQQDNHSNSNSSMPALNIPPLVASDLLNTGLHTAPVQSMEQFYAKNVNPFDRI